MPQPEIKPVAEQAATPPSPLPSDPAKAKRFFEFAARHGTPIDGMTTYWVYGLREVPADPAALKDFLKFADENQGKVRVTGELQKEIKTDERAAHVFCRALLASVTNPLDGKAATACIEFTSRHSLNASTEILAERALTILALGKTGRGDMRASYLKLIDALRPIKSMELAERAAVAVSKLFPQDSALSDLAKNVSAERAIVEQRLDRPANEIDFRDNIKDPNRQRQLEEADRITGNVTGIDEKITQARAALEAEPSSGPAVAALTDLLVRRNAGGDEQAAYELLTQKGKELNNSALRQRGGDLLLRRLERELKTFEGASPDDTAGIATRKKNLALARHGEFELRATEEPQNKRTQLELGRALLDLGKSDEAIPRLQNAFESPEHLLSAGKGLMQAFIAQNLFPEAVKVYRAVLAPKKLGDDDAYELGRSLAKLILSRAEQETQPCKATAVLAGLDLTAELLTKKFKDREILALRRKFDEILFAA